MLKRSQNNRPARGHKTTLTYPKFCTILSVCSAIHQSQPHLTTAMRDNICKKGKRPKHHGIQCHPMSSNVIQCHPMSSNVIQCHPMSSNVIQCHPMSSNVIQCHPMSSNVIQCHPMSSNVIQCHPMSSNVIQCHPMSLRHWFARLLRDVLGGHITAHWSVQRSVQRSHRSTAWAFLAWVTHAFAWPLKHTMNQKNNDPSVSIIFQYIFQCIISTIFINISCNILLVWYVYSNVFSVDRDLWM